MTPGESLAGRLVAVEGFNLGRLDPVHDALDVAALAVEHGAETLLIPVFGRRQRNDLSDEMATGITILNSADRWEAPIPALGERRQRAC